MKIQRDIDFRQPGFFRLSRLARSGIYLVMLCAIFLFGLRWIESAITFHPVRHSPRAEWKLPERGEEVWFTNSQGKKLNGCYLPAAKSGAPGTVLYAHGNGGNLTYVNGVAQQLSQAGLNVLTFDYQGYGKSEGSVPDEIGLYADGDAAFDYLIHQRGVKTRELLLYGTSLGTTVITDLASRRECAGIILEAGLSSADEMANHAVPWLPRWLHFLGKNRFESARKLKNIRCPVLITHGDQDEVIPTEQGRRLYASANEPKRLVIVPGGTHWLPSSGEKYFAEVSGFLLESLKRNGHPQAAGPSGQVVR
jgi:hypothetical protein